MADPKKEVKNKPLEKVETDAVDQNDLIKECVQHERDSYDYLAPSRNTWDEKESILIAKLEDDLSKTVKSKVFEPVLSTSAFERSARVMAQPPSGRAYAVSRDDLGKNLFMNLLLKYYQTNANEEGAYLLKLRFLDLYSAVYGSMFGLVPWRVNLKNGFIGPEILPIEMRNARPQPMRKSLDVSDWFGTRGTVSIEWLKQQDPKIWMNVDEVIAQLKAKKDSGASGKTTDTQTRSYVERQRYPTIKGDVTFPDLEIFTEYRREMWITWTPRLIDVKNSRPWILRVVKNPYPYNLLPIIVKHAFPLIDSIIGLGDFERGKTLQFALNSLINLYLDGVKYGIFPPLHINLDEVMPTSIKWAPGEKWYMNHPNIDVQVMNMQSTQWLNTFQSTYGFLFSAIQNLSGSTSVVNPEGIQTTEGKTPQAIKSREFRQSARDEWDRFMMEDTIRQIYERWMALLVDKLDIPVTMRIFGTELQEIQKRFPNEKIIDVFKSGERGQVKIDKTKLSDGKEPVKYDFDLEEGSTIRHDTVDEGEAASSVIADLTQSPWLLQEIRAKGKDIDIAELYKRRLIGSGVRDWDKIIIEPEQQVTNQPNTQAGVSIGQPREQVTQGQPAAQPQAQVMPTEPSQAQSVKFNDQDIAAAANQIFGGVSGIPAQG